MRCHTVWWWVTDWQLTFCVTCIHTDYVAPNQTSDVSTDLKLNCPYGVRTIFTCRHLFEWNFLSPQKGAEVPLPRHLLPARDVGAEWCQRSLEAAEWRSIKVSGHVSSFMKIVLLLYENSVAPVEPSHPRKASLSTNRPILQKSWRHSLQIWPSECAGRSLI